MYNHFAGDPHWIVSRWKSNCEGCGAVINRGTKAFYYPKVNTFIAPIAERMNMLNSGPRRR